MNRQLKTGLSALVIAVASPYAQIGSGDKHRMRRRLIRQPVKTPR
mgnify:CR=1 FL=1|jgi:hypothetical protein